MTGAKFVRVPLKRRVIWALPEFTSAGAQWLEGVMQPSEA